MQNLLEDLTALLQAEQAFISDGVILKNVVLGKTVQHILHLMHLLADRRCSHRREANSADVLCLETLCPVHSRTPWPRPLPGSRLLANDERGLALISCAVR